jgi:transposase
MTVSATARTLGVHRTTVSAWWNRFKRHGREALASKKRDAQPRPLLTPAQEAQLLRVLRDKVAHELGLGEALWIREAVANWAARELGVKRSC